MPSVKYQQVNTYYIGNDPNTTVTGVQVDGVAGNEKLWAQSTGWHFIPNNLYQNYMTPKQWFDLVSNHDKFRLASVETTIQNLIPLTDNLSIAQDTTFISFNNTIYALGYVDNHYECNFQEERTNLLWREGVQFVQPATGNPTVHGILGLPKYTHFLPHSGGKPLAIYGWDPLCHGESISELRPGKNSISYKWNRHPSDDDKWYSTSVLYSTTNTADVSNKPVMEKEEESHFSRWLTPGQKVKNWPTNAANQQFYQKASTVYPHWWNYPIPMWFIKLMPIFGTNNQQLKHSAQIVVVRNITFDVTPRTNTTNFPQLDYHYADVNNMWGTYPTGPFDTNKWFKYAFRPAENVGMPMPASFENQAAPWVPTTTPSLATSSKTTLTYSSPAKIPKK